MTTLSIRNISLNIGKTPILENVNTEISGSGNIVLFGPNGAGKSSLLKIITGIIDPLEGDVIVNGFSIINEREKALSQLGAHIEPGSFYPQLTGREVLSLIEKIRSNGKASCDLSAEDMINRLSMNEYADKKIGTYSTGMRRNLAVASAVVCAPPIILLDEPTDGLDPLSTARMNDLMFFLHNEKNCLLVTTSHDIEGAELISTRKLILMYGSIVFDSKKESNRVTMRLTVSNPRAMNSDILGAHETEFLGSTVLIKNLKRQEIGGVLRELSGALDIENISFETEFRNFYESFLKNGKK